MKDIMNNNEFVKETFSCGNSCPYRLEERLNLLVVDSNVGLMMIKVQTDDDISKTRVLSYLLDAGFIKRNVIECSHFKGDNFIITIDSKDINNELPSIGQKIIGVKRK